MPTDAGRKTVAPTQPNAVSTTTGDCVGYRHNGKNLANATGGACPGECHTTTCYL